MSDYQTSKEISLNAYGSTLHQLKNEAVSTMDDQITGEHKMTGSYL